jgi:rhodanese-related sulfurtransferase
MAEFTMTSADDTYQKMKSGKALLVCAYKDDDRFRKLRLEGAISLKDFESRMAKISKDQEIIFYCA